MKVDITNIIKQSAKFNIVRIIAGLISIPKNIVIASFLLPDDYGVVGFFGLWLMYAGLINPGVVSAGFREVPYLLGKKEEEKMLRLQNISISADLLYSLFPFLFIVCASFFFANSVIKIGLIITAGSFVCIRFFNYWDQVNFLRQKFTVVAKGQLINAFSVFITIVALIHWFKVYAVIFAPIVGAIFMGVYYWKKGPIGYKFQFDWLEIKRLFKVGIVLSLGSLAFWGYKMADRTIIALSLPLKDLGIYVYAMGFVLLGWNFFADFGRVLQPVFWKQSGEAKDIINAFNDTKRVAIYLAVGTALAIPFSQICFYLLVNLITTKYMESISVYYILSCNLYLASIIVIPNLILSSKVVNKQVIPMTIHLVGLGLNIILDLLAVYLGYGICGVAWVTVITQGIATFLAYFLSRKYMFVQNKEFAFFAGLISLPFLLSILFTAFHIFLGSLIPNPWAFSGISLSIQAIVWSVVLWVGYRKYFPKEKMVSVVKELTNLAIKQIKNR